MNEKDKDLFKAVERGDLNEVKLALENGADIKARDGEQRTPLHVAAYYGRSTIAELLLSNHAEVDARDHAQSTPLHTAASSGMPGIMRILIKNGAEVDARDIGSRTPLHNTYSQGRGRIEAARVLIKNHADVNAREPRGQSTTVHMNASCCNTEFVKLLPANGADPTAKSRTGRTARELAEMDDHPRLAEISKLAEQQGPRSVHLTRKRQPPSGDGLPSH